MTIEEIRKAKRDVEQKILRDIEAFRQETGLVVKGVQVTRYLHKPLECQFGDEIVGDVRLEVDLGL